MNFGSEPADQVLRLTLEGSEVVLKLSGSAAKNFALFVYAILKDQKKTRGKTRLVRMLRQERPFKFFRIPKASLKEFAKEAHSHGLLYTMIQDKKHPDTIELVVFADDAAKVSRVLDNLNLDYVKAQAGEATIEQPNTEPGKAENTPAVETVNVEGETVAFDVSADEELYCIGESVVHQPAANFMNGEEPAAQKQREKNPSGHSSPNNDSLPGRAEDRTPRSVRKELREIRAQHRRRRTEKTLGGKNPPSRGKRRKKKAKGR